MWLKTVRNRNELGKTNVRTHKFDNTFPRGNPQTKEVESLPVRSLITAAYQPASVVIVSTSSNER